MKFRKLKAWVSVHKLPTFLITTSLLAVIIIPPSVVYTRNNTNSKTGEGIAQNKELIKQSSVSIKLPSSDSITNYPSNLITNTQIAAILSNLPSGTKINGESVDFTELFNYNESLWIEILGKNTPTREDGLISFTNLQGVNTALPTLTLSVFADSVSSSSSSSSDSDSTAAITLNYQDSTTAQNIFTSNLLPSEVGKIKAVNIFSCQFTVLDIIDWLAQEKEYNLSQQQWADALENADISYTGGNITITGAEFNSVDLGEIKLTNFNENDGLNISTYLSDYGMATTEDGKSNPLYNNISEVYSYNYPLVNMVYGSNFSKSDYATTYANYYNYNMAAILANSYETTDSATPEPQVTQEVDGKYYVSTFNLDANLSYWTSFLYNKNNSIQKTFFSYYNKLITSSTTNEPILASSSSSSTNSYSSTLPNVEINYNANYYSDVSFIALNGAITFYNVDNTLNNTTPTTLTMDLTNSKGDASVQTYNFSNINYESFSIDGFKNISTSSSSSGETIYDLNVNVNDLSTQNLSSNLLSAFTDYTPMDAVYTNADKTSGSDIGVNWWKLIAQNDTSSNVYTDDFDWFLTNSFFNLINFNFVIYPSYTWKINYASNSLTNYINSLNSSTSSSSSTSSTSAVSTSSSSSSTTSSLTSTGELLINNLVVTEPGVSVASELPTIDVTISGFEGSKNYYSLPSNSNLYNFALTDNELINLLNQNTVLDNKNASDNNLNVTWTENLLNNANIYTLNSKTANLSTLNNQYTYSTTVGDGILINFSSISNKITTDTSNNSTGQISFSAPLYFNLYIIGFSTNYPTLTSDIINSEQNINLASWQTYLTTNNIDYYALSQLTDSQFYATRSLVENSKTIKISATASKGYWGSDTQTNDYFIWHYSELILSSGESSSK